MDAEENRVVRLDRRAEQQAFRDRSARTLRVGVDFATEVGALPTHAKVLPNKQNKWLVFWCWKVATEEIDPSPQSYIILPVSDILARVTNETEQARQH